ncbi:MAG TPA: metalloregulator ArsR/SmtB family transcription factor [Hyphomicrobiaceae bacterium]|nr:metalloregulator ArsR/SmtB family transcription factor [Hyphomicrobiaceae bacterium]
MTTPPRLAPPTMLEALKAAADPTRLRLLALLAGGELNVSDLTTIVGQSQPRVSRHLKILAEAGLIERFRDGSWVFLSLASDGPHAAIARSVLALMETESGELARDRERLHRLVSERERAAQAYFDTHAAEWDRIRALHVAEGEVEDAMRRALGSGPFKLLVDLGTGTGRMLELFADRYERAVGFDINAAMLAYAQSRLQAAALTHAQVRHGDLRSVRLPDGSASVVVMHQVLHFLADPSVALREAARILAPGGRLLVVDFAPHDLEFLREDQAHVRLGFSDEVMEGWLADCGLETTHRERLIPRGRRKNDAGELTVSLWLAAPVDTTSTPAKKRKRNLEATSP